MHASHHKCVHTCLWRMLYRNEARHRRKFIYCGVASMHQQFAGSNGGVYRSLELATHPTLHCVAMLLQKQTSGSSVALEAFHHRGFNRKEISSQKSGQSASGDRRGDGSCCVTDSSGSLLLATGSADSSIIIWRVQLFDAAEPWQLVTRLSVRACL